MPGRVRTDQSDCARIGETGRRFVPAYFFTSGKRVIAYLRAFMTDGGVKIGRVLTLEHKKGLGSALMEKSIDDIKKRFDTDKIIVHAQKQAAGFYSKMGFAPVSGEYLEEGVVHLTMELKIK